MIILDEESGRKKTDFLLDVYVSEFDDNYHRLGDEPSSDLERAAKRIRRRYKNISDYMDALATYYEYIGVLMDRYGGKEIFKVLLKDNMIPEFIPPKPRMKNNATSKFMLKNKILLSRTNMKKMDVEKIKKVKEELDEVSSDAPFIRDTDTKDKRALKLSKKEDFTAVHLPTIRKSSNLGFLEEYMRNKQEAKKNEEQPEYPTPSLHDLSKHNFEEYIDPNSTKEEDEVVMFNGNFVHNSVIEDVKIYREIGNLGWNSARLMSQHGMGKKYTKMVSKPFKKGKKNKKKEDDFLDSVMEDNNMGTFEDFERDMLNMSMENIFSK